MITPPATPACPVCQCPLDLAPPVPILDLTPIRHRLAPRPRRTAMEEVEWLEARTRRREWAGAVLATLAIAAGLVVVALAWQWGAGW